MTNQKHLPTVFFWFCHQRLPFCLLIPTSRAGTLQSKLLCSYVLRPNPPPSPGIHRPWLPEPPLLVHARLVEERRVVDRAADQQPGQLVQSVCLEGQRLATLQLEVLFPVGVQVQHPWRRKESRTGCGWVKRAVVASSQSKTSNNPNQTGYRGRRSFSAPTGWPTQYPPPPMTPPTPPPPNTHKTR